MRKSRQNEKVLPSAPIKVDDIDKKKGWIDPAYALMRLHGGSNNCNSAHSR